MPFHSYKIPVNRFIHIRRKHEFYGKIEMLMDEAILNHYGKSTAALVDKAFLIERDAAVLLPESFTSHRFFLSFPPILGPTSQFSKRFQLRMCDGMLALKQQAAECDHIKRGTLAPRYLSDIAKISKISIDNK